MDLLIRSDLPFTTRVLVELSDQQILYFSFNIFLNAAQKTEYEQWKMQSAIKLASLAYDFSPERSKSERYPKKTWFNALSDYTVSTLFN